MRAKLSKPPPPPPEVSQTGCLQCSMLGLLWPATPALPAKRTHCGRKVSGGVCRASRQPSSAACLAMAALLHQTPFVGRQQCMSFRSNVGSTQALRAVVSCWPILLMHRLPLCISGAGLATLTCFVLPGRRCAGRPVAGAQHGRPQLAAGGGEPRAGEPPAMYGQGAAEQGECVWCGGPVCPPRTAGLLPGRGPRSCCSLPVLSRPSLADPLHTHRPQEAALLQDNCGGLKGAARRAATGVPGLVRPPEEGGQPQCTRHQEVARRGRTAQRHRGSAAQACHGAHSPQGCLPRCLPAGVGAPAARPAFACCCWLSLLCLC